MNSMVVIPQSTGTLHIWVIIVFEFSNFCHILRPTIKGRTGIRAVKVDRVGVLGPVDEPHDALGAPGNDECGSWSYAVVANKLCCLQVGIDLFCEWRDLNFVIEKVIPRYGVCEDPGYRRLSAAAILFSKVT